MKSHSIFTEVAKEQSLFNFLATAREEPQEYPLNRSGARLDRVIFGWTHVICDLRLSDDAFKQFTRWQDATSGYDTFSFHALSHVRKEFGDQAAFDWYFKTFDEYRGNTPPHGNEKSGPPTPVRYDESRLKLLMWSRHRPAMYFGEATSTALSATLVGCRWCLEWLNRCDPVFDRFEKWMIESKQKGSERESSLDYLAGEMGDENSLLFYYIAFDEYMESRLG